MMSNIIIFIEATRETGVCFLIPIRGSYDKEINSSAREIFLQLTTPLQATIVSILLKVVDEVNQPMRRLVDVVAHLAKEVRMQQRRCDLPPEASFFGHLHCKLIQRRPK